MCHIAYLRAKAEKMVWMRDMLGLQKALSVSSSRANFTLSERVKEGGHGVWEISNELLESEGKQEQK